MQIIKKKRVFGKAKNCWQKFTTKKYPKNPNLLEKKRTRPLKVSSKARRLLNCQKNMKKKVKN